MREIKFRAWDKSTGEMFVPNGMMDFYGGIPHFADVEDIVPMQYTGLKDKNGVEIYEGDLIRFTSPRKSGITKRTKLPTRLLEVVWRDDKARWGIKVLDTEPVQWQHLPDIAADINHEVIGNVYENPELVI